MKNLNRIYHPWWKWECYPAGFYAGSPPEGLDARSAMDLYASFLGDLARFDAAISRVFSTWKHSCEQFLTNESMNRIAWIGQASACIDSGLPSKFRAGFKLLSNEQQKSANELANHRLEEWVSDQWRRQSN